VEFEFIADRPVLDFVPTVSDRGTADVEKLRSGADVTAWIAASGLVDTAPVVGDADLPRVKAVREALFGLIAAVIDGRAPAPADRALVNATAAGVPPVLRLDDDGLHRTGDLGAVLAALARDGLDLVAGPDAAFLHWCADETCTRPFLDRSRGQRRRWCGMKGCGDRAKAAAYRQRKRATAASRSAGR
jgi:predicted RNA-binding Zn ribbon-like protein